MPRVESPEAVVLNEIEKVLSFVGDEVQIKAGIGEEMTDARDLIFTGQIYIYSEKFISEAIKKHLSNEARNIGYKITFRDFNYVKNREKWEKPQAFICHDSRDKVDIAEPLAIQLQKLSCPVWYDEFSLKVGDSLREGIEKGLRECSNCVLLLTPNFLNNEGWTKREYDSVFTREVMKKENVILPVWHNVSLEDVYRYSPSLSNKLALPWSLGVEEVAKKLVHAIQSK